MRNNHSFKQTIECKCPHESCGKPFVKRVTVDYVTNQRGDVIEQRIR